MLCRVPSVTIVGLPGAPVGLRWRTRRRTPLPASFSSIQEMKRPPALSKATEVWPKELPALTRMGLPKVAPASSEKASCVLGVSWASVYQPMATRLSFETAAGPLTGQASICHLSALSDFGGDQWPLV